MKKKPASKKRNDKALAAYYDSQSEDQIVDEIKSKNWRPWHIKPEGARNRATRIHLSPETIHQIKALAAAKGIEYQTLLRIWVEERVRKEARVS